MFQKDVVNPDRMPRRLEKPRILLLDCPLEYKKGENQTAVELANDDDFAELLRQEEEVCSWRCLPRCDVCVGGGSMCAAVARVWGCYERRI